MINLKKLHHNAYRCIDSEETRKFYEDFLGLPLALVISGECFPVLPSDMTDYLFFKTLHEFLSYNSALGRVDLALQFQAVTPHLFLILKNMRHQESWEQLKETI